MPEGLEVTIMALCLIMLKDATKSISCSASAILGHRNVIYRKKMKVIWSLVKMQIETILFDHIILANIIPLLLHNMPLGAITRAIVAIRRTNRDQLAALGTQLLRLMGNIKLTISLDNDDMYSTVIIRKIVILSYDFSDLKWSHRFLSIDPRIADIIHEDAMERLIERTKGDIELGKKIMAVRYNSEPSKSLLFNAVDICKMILGHKTK
jgi:hypothetical protein